MNTRNINGLLTVGLVTISNQQAAHKRITNPHRYSLVLITHNPLVPSSTLGGPTKQESQPLTGLAFLRSIAEREGSIVASSGTVRLPTPGYWHEAANGAGSEITG